MQTSSPYSKIEAAVRSGHLDTLLSLLQEYADELNKKGWLNDLLRYACSKGTVQTVSLFVQFGADINAPKAASRPEGAIDDAAAAGNTEVVAWLLEHGARVNYVVKGHRRCFPLSSAILGNHLDVVRLLTETGGADINAAWANQNALTFAMMCGHKEIEDYLRSKGAVDASIPEYPRSPIAEHIEKHLGPVAPLSVQEIVRGNQPIAVHAVLTKDALALVTEGMSDSPMQVPVGGEQYRYAELIIYLPKNWPITNRTLDDPQYSWPIEWLRRIALYPRENGTWLGGPITVIANGDPPEPLIPDMQFSSFLLLAENIEWGRLLLSDGRSIRFYTLMPLYTEERALELRAGVSELLRLFERYRISKIVEIGRKNVAI